MRSSLNPWNRCDARLAAARSTALWRVLRARQAPVSQVIFRTLMPVIDME